MRLLSAPVAGSIFCETWKSPSYSSVLMFTVVGFSSVSCWVRKGKRVAPQRAVSSTGVGAAAESERRERMASAVVEARIAKVVLKRMKIVVEFLEVAIVIVANLK